MKKRLVRKGEAIHILGNLIHNINTCLIDGYSLAELGFKERVALWKMIEQRLPYKYSKNKFYNTYNMLCNLGITLNTARQEFRYFYGPKDFALDLLQIVPELFEGHELDTVEQVETVRRMIEALVKKYEPSDKEFELLARLYEALERSSSEMIAKLDYDFETIMKLL